MSKGRYLYRRDGSRIFFKMKGYLKFTESFGLDHLIDELLEQDIDQALIDLNEVSYIDSTNLGIIARIAEAMRRRNKSLTIYSENDDVNDILASVGFDKVCVILKHHEDVRNLAEVASLEVQGREMAESMIRAHRKLIEMNEANKEVFQDIIELMEEDARKYYQE